MSSQIILSLDTASIRPSVSLWVDGVLHSVSLAEVVDSSGRLENALFTNHIFNLCDEQNVLLKDITHFVFCDGPGPFSGLRIAAIIGRLFFRLNPNINVFKMGLLQLYYTQLFIEGYSKKYLAIQGGGLNTYFVEEYTSEKIRSAAALYEKNTIPACIEKIFTSAELAEHEWNLSQVMIELCLQNSQNLILLQNINEIMPNYIKEPGITMSKKNKS